MSYGATLAGANQALDSSLNTVYSEFLILRDETGVFRSCATDMPLQPHDGASKNINNYGRLQAFELDDGVDMAQAQQLADSTTTITPGEVGVQVLLPGTTVRRIADPSLLQRVGRMLNAAYDLKEDQDGGLQLVNATATMGVAGAVIGPGEYYGSVTRVMVGNNLANPEPAPMPIFTVDNPVKLAVLAGNLVPFTDVPTGTNRYTSVTPTTGRSVMGGGNGEIGQEIIKRHIGALGELFSTTCKKTANLLPNSSDDVSGGVFSKEFLIYVSEVPPKLDPDNTNKSMRGAVELNLWGSYAWGNYRPGAYAVEVIGDCLLPAAS